MQLKNKIAKKLFLLLFVVFIVILRHNKETAFMLTIQHLIKLQPVLKIMPLAAEAGLNPQTIAGKMRRETQLNVDESKALEEALKKNGLILYEPLRPVSEFQ